MGKKVRWWFGSEPKNCDVCAKKITDTFIDGKTTYGPWGILCPECHDKNGMGLGTGKGQKYSRSEGTDRFYKVGG